jgi:hypothetical protein
VFVVLDVYRHSAPSRVFSSENEVHQVLHRLERVAATADEQPEVFALDVDDGEYGTAAVPGGNRFADGDLGVDIQDSEQVIHRLGREVHFYGVDIGIDGWLIIARRTFAGRPGGAGRPIVSLAAPFGPCAATWPAAIAWRAVRTSQASTSAAALEVRVGQLRLRLFEPGTGAVTAWAARSSSSRATRRALAGGAVTSLTTTLATARNAGVGRARLLRNAVLWGQADNPHNSVLAAAAEEAALLPLIEDGHFHFIEASPELGERLVTGVFDGFAACFGLIHSLSSIHELGYGWRARTSR